MDKTAYRSILQQRGWQEKSIQSAMATCEKFEDYIEGNSGQAMENVAWGFSKILIKDRKNTITNYLALIFYGMMHKNNEIFIAFFELFDGGEVSKNLYRKVAQRFGKEVRDEVFSGIGVAPYGVPSPDKPAYLLPVIGRLNKKVGEKACREFLSAGLRHMPERDYIEGREKFRQAGDIDAYLNQKKKDFLANLEACQREGRPFFTQEITTEVLDFVRKNPEMGGGMREGNIVYETKIPYMAKQYLAETNPTLRRYYACHCPWARYAIKNGNVKITPVLCYCSGGFHKKGWEVIFKQPLKVEVLESVLGGGDCCRFAIHLPEEALKKIK